MSQLVDKRTDEMQALLDDGHHLENHYFMVMEGNEVKGIFINPVSDEDFRKFSRYGIPENLVEVDLELWSDFESLRKLPFVTTNSFFDSPNSPLPLLRAHHQEQRNRMREARIQTGDLYFECPRCSEDITREPIFHNCPQKEGA